MATCRYLPSRPNPDQLKRQAKERLRAEPSLGRLRDAQSVIAQEYGFNSWDALRLHIESRAVPATRGLIKPEGFNSAEGQAVWDVIDAASSGDTATLRRLLDANPRLSREGYYYTQKMHFAVRGGHLEAVEVLLRAGADPEWNGYYQGSLIEMAVERGHTPIAQLLDEARQRLGRVAPGEELPIHRAAQSDDVNAVRRILDADPALLERGDRDGGSPLHRAVCGSARRVVEFLLDRGANIHAYHSTSRGGGGWWTTGVQAIDLAIWGSNLLAWAKRGSEDRQVAGIARRRARSDCRCGPRRSGDRRSEREHRLQTRLTGAAEDRPIQLNARAWAVKGTVMDS